MESVICCSNRETLAFFLSRAEVSVVVGLALPFDSLFPSDLREVLRSQRPQTEIAVASTDALRALGHGVGSNELAVFLRTTLVARIDPNAGDTAELWRRVFDTAAARAHRLQVCSAVVQCVDRAVAAQSSEATANDDPFAILDVPPTATIRDAEAARKTLVPQYHPDRVKAAGLGPALVRDAEAHMKRINGAVDEIRRRRTARQ